MFGGRGEEGVREAMGGRGAQTNMPPTPTSQAGRREPPRQPGITMHMSFPPTSLHAGQLVGSSRGVGSPAQRAKCCGLGMRATRLYRLQKGRLPSSGSRQDQRPRPRGGRPAPAAGRCLAEAGRTDGRTDRRAPRSAPLAARVGGGLIIQRGHAAYFSEVRAEGSP